MNIANILTLTRMIMIPFFLFFFSLDSEVGKLLATIIFIVASFTDFLDGYLARKYHLITNFGKIMDPLADKLLVLSALLALIANQQVPVWIVILILARELGITGMRAVAAGEGVIIHAAPLGKVKTVVQMLSIILLILNISGGLFLLYIALLLTWISGIDYIIKFSKQIAWN